MCEALENSPLLQRARSRSSSFFPVVGSETGGGGGGGKCRHRRKGGTGRTAVDTSSQISKIPPPPKVEKKRRPGLLNKLISFLVPKHRASPPFIVEEKAKRSPCKEDSSLLHPLIGRRGLRGFGRRRTQLSTQQCMLPAIAFSGGGGCFFFFFFRPAFALSSPPTES